MKPRLDLSLWKNWNNTSASFSNPSNSKTLDKGKYCTYEKMPTHSNDKCKALKAKAESKALLTEQQPHDTALLLEQQPKDCRDHNQQSTHSKCTIY